MWLTEFRRFRAVDGRDGRNARGPASWRVHDLGLDLGDEERAVAATLVLRQGPFRRPVIRDWGVVRAVDRRRRLLVLDGARLPASTEPVLAGPTEARRFAPAAGDILDSLVLDLVGGRAARIGDLLLRVEDGDDGSGGGERPVLVVEAADLGPWALVRRLTRGRVDRAPAARDLVAWRDLEYFRGDPGTAERARDAHARLALLPPGEIARLAGSLPYPHVTELVAGLDVPVAARVLEAMPTERGCRALAALPPGAAGRVLDLMAPDAVARYVASYAPDEAIERLESMNPVRRAPAVELLRYPPGTVGAAMTNEVVRLPAAATIAEARSMAAPLLARAAFVHFLYAEDAEGRLAGVLALRHLVVEPDDRRIADVMTSHLVTLRPLERAIDGARLVLDTHLQAVPVVGAERRLLGALTVDGAIALAAEAGWRAEPARIFS